MRAAAAVALAALLAGCGGGAVVPDWQVNSLASLRNFEAAYFAGNVRVADAEFARARADLASTGRADLVARAELVRCAAQVASLAFDDCPGFTAVAADSGAAERAYAAYLAGQWQALDANSLPPQHRPVVATAGAALPEDAFARLVAAGALFRAGRARPETISAAIETASAQGWRRPLLAWLGVAQKRASEAGDAAAAAALSRRIELVSGGGTSK